MSIILAIGLLLVIYSILYFILSKIEDRSDSRAWELYKSSSDSVLGKFLASAGRPIASSNIVRDFNGTKTYNFIYEKLSLGDTFQSSVEIFVSTQLASLIFGSGFLFFAIIASLPFAIKLAFILIAFFISFWPIAEILSKSKTRSSIISSELPEFTELLLMVAPSMSVPAALSFTCERVKGVVSMEISELVNILTTRSMNEREAFDLIGKRLATIDGKQFISVIQSGYIEGTRIVEQLNSLAEQMRKTDFQRKRAYAKKLPVKLVILFAIHFIPFLMGISFLPVIYGFTKLGSP